MFFLFFNFTLYTGNVVLRHSEPNETLPFPTSAKFFMTLRVEWRNATPRFRDTQSATRARMSFPRPILNISFPGTGIEPTIGMLTVARLMLTVAGFCPFTPTA